MRGDSRAAVTAAADRFGRWFKDDALAYWASTGRDARHGASIERVEADGSIDPAVPIRLRVQARQLFVYASAVERGWADSASYVDALWQFLDTAGRHPGRAGYRHTIVWPDGARDDRLDLYDHAFFLLATALHHRITHEPASRHRAHEIMTLLDTALLAPEGGWREGDYDAPFRRQNPHMHLFEAFMAWHETDQDERWLVKAAAIYELFRAHFFDAENGVVREYFGADWAAPTDPNDDIAEPGHLLEWVWLLDWYQRLTGTATDAEQQRLFATAVTHGAEDGLMIDTLRRNATPRERSKRLWPMTEYIKAACVRLAAGDAAAADHVVRAVDGLFVGFIETAQHAPYVDRLDSANAVVDARSPASSMYHLAAAQIELERLLAVAED